MRYTLATRYIPEGIQGLRNSANRVSGSFLLAASIVGALAAETVVNVEGMAGAPSEALGSLVTGSVGSSLSTAPAAIVWVADATIDWVYPASYAQIRSASSTSVAPEWRTVPFSSIPRST
jgi:hypothetical protein